jgi:hypothetical protein
MNSVTPKPRRARLSAVGLVGFVGLLPVTVDPPLLEGSVVVVVFGRRWLGLVAGRDLLLPEAPPVAFGRVVMNAPRTSSSCAKTRTWPTPVKAINKPKIVNLNLICESLLNKTFDITPNTYERSIRLGFQLC